MSKWVKQRLGDVADIIMGQSPESKYYNESGEGLPFFQGVTDFGEKYPSVSKWTTSANKIAIEKDILFSVRAPVGDINVAKIKCALGRGVCAIRSKNGMSEFLYFLLRGNIRKIINFGNGSIYDSINKPILEKIELLFPDLPTQTRIASILSAYDDLIENNERRIKVLEEMAQLLYTEWFVKFNLPAEVLTKAGFPNGKIKLIDSNTSYGKIPEGWEVRRLGDIAILTMGQSPTSDHYNTESVGLPFHQGVADFGLKYPNDRVFSTAGNKFAESRDLLFSVRAPVGQMNIANKKIILGRGLSAIRHNEGFQSFLILAFTIRFIKKDMIGNGAIYKSVNKEEMENLKFVIPEHKILLQFEQIVEKYFQELEKLSNINQTLSQTRDLLIPQLVTGRRELK